MNTLTATLVGSLMMATTLNAEPVVSFDRFDFAADHRSGLIAGGVWAPVEHPTYVSEIGGNAIFEPLRAYIGAAIPDGKLPLIILSHGSGSSMDGMAWLGVGLAAQGAIVVVLNHPGTTSGDSSPRRTIRLSERAADVSAALDHVLQEPHFAQHIDTDHITALGFSLGGSVALGLAGQRLNGPAYAQFCAEHGEAAPDCLFLAKGGVDLTALPPEFSADMHDARFTHIVAVDPGFTHAAVAETQETITTPVQIITLGKDTNIASFDMRSTGLLDNIAKVEHVVIPDAHHFSFLPICTDIAPELLIEEGEDPICTDPEGSDRAHVHKASLQAISAFLGL